MKIRRILATAVAAAVTTPAVFLSAAPAFADTPSVPGQTVQDGSEDDGPGEGDYDEYEKLAVAVEKAQAKLDDLKAQRKALLQDLRDGNIGEAVKTELAEAKAADAAAAAALTAAQEALTAAEDALAKLKEPGSTATPEQITAAEQAVTDAKTAVEGKEAAATGTQLRLEEAQTAWDDARVALSRKIGLLAADIVVAEQELAEAEDALDEFENGGGKDDCAEDPALTVALTGPEAVTAGKAAAFSMKIANTSDETMNQVEAFASAFALSDEAIDEEGELDEDSELDEDDLFGSFVTVEWSTADQPKWTKFSEEGGPIVLGALNGGVTKDVKLRVTVDEDAPAGQGVVFGASAHEPDTENCGMGMDTAEFDILAAEDEKPTPEPTEKPTDEPTATPSPEPSVTTTTPAPVATATSGGNTNTTAQGGSHATGALAATGANDSTRTIGLTAAGAVALGAGALFFARRRKADAKA
ncbi:hypothetical protein [Streptomyces sp. NPDC056144]|uniref:hypothetical protein n=1 Tax=unclassified Streptomyces TaxID=2593676 RepID=UPI0035E0F606